VKCEIAKTGQALFAYSITLTSGTITLGLRRREALLYALLGLLALSFLADEVVALLAPIAK